MSLKALDNDTEYHADLADRAKAAKGTTAMFHLARFYGRLEKGRDYDRDSVFREIRDAKSEKDLDDILEVAHIDRPDASASTRRQWKKAADRMRERWRGI